MTTKYIDVDQQAIAEGRPDPINIRMRDVGEFFLCIRANDIFLGGLTRVRYCPVKPMPFGARVWIEVEGPVMYKASTNLDWERIS